MCNCKSNICLECKDAEISHIKTKLIRYEKAIKLLLDDSIIYSIKNNNNNSHNSIIVDKDLDGHVNTHIYSDIGENYIVLEKGKNLDELSNIEKQSIDKQNDFKNYKKIVKYSKLSNKVYSTISKIGGIIGIL